MPTKAPQRWTFIQLAEMAKWMKDAKCRGNYIMFPRVRRNGETAKYDGPQERAAKALCATCPVRKPCLEYALDTNEEFGIWGGLNTAERRRIRRDRALERKRREMSA